MSAHFFHKLGRTTAFLQTAIPALIIDAVTPPTGCFYSLQRPSAFSIPGPNMQDKFRPPRTTQRGWLFNKRSRGFSLTHITPWQRISNVTLRSGEREYYYQKAVLTFNTVPVRKN